MNTPTTTSDPLVEALSTRMRMADLVSWQRITALAEDAGLSFEDLRLLLAFAAKTGDGPSEVSELAELAGFPLGVGYPAVHGLRRRGYLHEDQRRYSLTAQGQDLVAALDAAHREGIQAYVEQLGREERDRLRHALTDPR
jgi:DNA-binding MarR family transcriptional regulator